METENDRSSIEKLKKKLYDPSETSQIIGGEVRHRVREQGNMPVQQVESVNAWGKVEIPSGVLDNLPKKTAPFFKGLFIASAVFCVAAFGIAMFFFLSDQLLISSDNVNITVNSPVTISGGEELPLQIQISNDNKVALKDAKVIVTYPDDSQDPSEVGKVSIREERTLEQVNSGAVASIQSSRIVFGEENEKKKVLVSIEYSTQSSRSRFRKEKEFEFLITRSPVSVTVAYQKEVNPAQPVDIAIEMQSNSTGPLQNLIFVASYPQDFVFESATPQATEGNNYWKIATLKPGEKRKFIIRGSFGTSDEEQRTLKFALGSEKADAEGELATVISNKSADFTIKKPFVSVTFESGSPAVGVFDAVFQNQMKIKNNLSQKIVDMIVEVRLSSPYYYRNAQYPTNGFYRSLDNTMIWDRTTIGQFANVDPGTERDVRFDVGLVKFADFNPRVRDPEVGVTVLVKGNIINARGVSERVEYTVPQKIKFPTALTGVGAVYAATGPYEALGPVPPRADQKTRYTVSWKLSNTVSHVSDTEVTATLPIYATYVDGPKDGSITYDAFNRTIRWKAGEVSAFAGINGAARETAFQIEIQPSSSQIGQTLQIISDASIKGTNRNLNTSVQAKIPALTTQAVDRPGQDKVVN